MKTIKIRNPYTKRINKLARVIYKLDPQSEHKIVREIQEKLRWRIIA